MFQRRCHNRGCLCRGWHGLNGTGMKNDSRNGGAFSGCSKPPARELYILRHPVRRNPAHCHLNPKGLSDDGRCIFIHRHIQAGGEYIQNPGTIYTTEDEGCGPHSCRATVSTSLLRPSSAPPIFTLNIYDIYAYVGCQMRRPPFEV